MVLPTNAAAAWKHPGMLVLLMLLAGDGFYMLLHLVNRYTAIFQDPLLSIEMDRGFAEFFQYLKYIWAMVLMIETSRRQQTSRYLGWCLVFLYFLLDDALRIHEGMGEHVAALLGLGKAMNMRGQDFGELIYLAVVGGGILLALAAAYRNADTAFRHTSHDLVVLIAILAGFGGAVDVLHQVVRQGPEVRFWLGTLEDGGEMVAMSLVTWRCFVAATAGVAEQPHLVGKLLPRWDRMAASR